MFNKLLKLNSIKLFISIYIITIQLSFVACILMLTNAIINNQLNNCIVFCNILDNSKHYYFKEDDYKTKEFILKH